MSCSVGDKSSSDDDDAGLNNHSTRFSSPFDWNAGTGTCTSHGLNGVLHNSSNVTRERFDVSSLVVPLLFASAQRPMQAGNTNNFTPSASDQQRPMVVAPKRKRKKKVQRSLATGNSVATNDAGKKKREQKPLPKCLQDVKIVDRDRFLHHPEDSDIAGEVVEVCCAVKTDTETVDLKKLNLDQLRRLCMVFGTKGAGQFNTLECKHKLCEFSHLQHCCQNLLNPNQSEGQLRSSTLIRLANVAFLPDFHGRLRNVNDVKKRKDCEGQSGERNPIKAFWAEMSDHLNDTENDVVVGMVAEKHLNEEPLPPEHPNSSTLRKLVDTDELDPAKHSQVTGAWCAQNFKDLMTARSNVAKAMGVSGERCNVLGECMRQTHVAVRKKVVMPFAPVHCICQHCEEHTDLDSSFAAFMEEDLKSDSANQGDIAKEVTDEPRTKKKDIDQLKDTVMESAKAIADEMKEANLDRKKIVDAMAIEARNKQWDLDDRKWNSLTSMTTKFEDLFEKSDGTAAALRPLSIRIQTLENELHETSMGSVFDDESHGAFKVEKNIDDGDVVTEKEQKQITKAFKSLSCCPQGV